LPIAKRTVVVINPTGTICFYKRGTPRSDEIREAIGNQSCLAASS
jgi:hypothetical protein